MAAVIAVGAVLAVIVVALLVVLLRVMSRLNIASAHAGARPAAVADPALAEAARRDAAEIRRRAEADAAEIRRQAEATAGSATGDARRAAEEEVHGLRAEARALKDEMHELKADLERREQRLAEREERLDAEQRRVEARDRELAEHEQALERRKSELADLEADRRRELERVAGLTAADAKTELVKSIETQAKREAAIIVRDIEQEAKDEGETRARKIVTLAIQRVASEQTSESVVSVLHLPSDDMKGRIIGREGRNIRAFEATTGVNLIIDDTPEAVLLSCFDPVRREVGRLTLEKLVLDGRIHPHRIEEVHERSKAEVEQLCVRAGEDALVEVGLTDMHPELIALLGQLRYRTSYGQNVLKHLIESAHIAGMMASELRLDPMLMKRCTVLHDVGKALTHEVEGSHAIIGAEIARKYGEHEDVVHAIEAHHNEVEVRTVEAVLTQAADGISGGRPGARRESLEHYVKRLERIEEIASEKPGVEKVFAMQAGREIRVMVKPDEIDDIAAQVIARDVAKQIEEELTYPGQIRITVVRESRATEYAK
ncbi:MAG TPA: ribonuclease Y [Mycobacteriales bacterium]|nr:ribonuclease Y [Mycobacteriales bacterium]